jgi:hypothetical protein
LLRFLFLFYCDPISLNVQGGATHVDIACDPELVKLAIILTSLPVIFLTL